MFIYLEQYKHKIQQNPEDYFNMLKHKLRDGSILLNFKREISLKERVKPSKKKYSKKDRYFIKNKKVFQNEF